MWATGFIGSPRMNFLRGQVGGGGQIILADHGGVAVPIALKAPPAVGTDLLIGVRPEHFSPAGRVRLSVDVELVEHLGGSSFAYARGESEHPLTIELRGSRETVGRLDIGFDPAQAYVFDKASGQRIR